MSVGLSVRTSGGREIEQDGSSGELQRLESSLAIDKVEGSHDESRLLLLVSLGPRSAQEVPFRLELVTDGTSESRLESSQEDSNRVVARRRGQSRVFIVVELEGSSCSQLLRSEVGELVGRAFLCCQSCKWQQEGCHGLEELHLVVMSAIGTTDRQRHEIDTIDYVCFVSPSSAVRCLAFAASGEEAAGGDRARARQGKSS